MDNWGWDTWGLTLMFSFAGFYLFHGWRTKTYSHPLMPAYLIIGMKASADILNQIYHGVVACLL